MWKMRWQFGGNLQPVRMICEFDWRECPSAVINYVWSEIVTDVVDCLTNESMMWRVIAMLFVCTLLIHTIYSKARWMDETTINRENLNIVGCKVQDLELKVNILTYKMQYGTWPLPRQIQGTKIDGGLRNVRLTLTNSSDRNTWLKHMLLSPAENAACLPYAKIGPRSVRCLTKLLNLETKYMSSRFSRDASPASNKVKSSRSSSDKSIKYEKIPKNSPDVVKTDEKPISNSESLGIRLKDSTKSSRRDTNNSWSETQVLKYREHPKPFSRQQRSYENNLNVSKKLSPSTKKSEDIINYSEQRGTSTQALNRREQPKSFARQQNSLEFDFKKIPLITRESELIDKSPEERVNSTQETLQKVTQKLENLHSVLRIYGNPDCTTNAHDEVCSNKELAESILQDLKNLGNLPIESESDGKISGIVLQLLDSNTEESQGAKEERDSASEFEQCQSDQNSSSARSNENSLDIQSNDFSEQADSKNVFKDNQATEENVEKSHEDPKTINGEKNNSQIIVKLLSRDSSPIKTSPLNKIPPVVSSDEEALKSVPAKTEEELLQPSLTSSQAELSKDSDADEKSNATLLREAMKFKKALLTQIELEKEQEKAENRREQKNEESEGESDEPWPKVKNYFQSKLLDIISEEQSASSSTEKTSKSPAFPNAFTQIKDPENDLNHQKNSIEATNSNSKSSKLALVSESSEYFSLSNLEEKMLAQNVVSSTAKYTVESSSDFTEDELSETKETAVEEKNTILQKNISDLVNQSVQNIREYIEVFSQMQNDAIRETKKAIIDENSTKSSNLLKDCSSEDSIMHFVNTVAIVDSMSEELPRELPKLAINSLVDLEAELSEEESPENSDYKPDFALKRRPGSISLAEENSTGEKQDLSCEAFDSRSIFESAHSKAEDDYPRMTDAEILSSEPSCKELVMDYLLESDSDFTDEKLPDTLDLIEFDEEMETRGKEDERRALDSPLTGRTVIRATSSLISNMDTESTSVGRSDNAEFEETGNSPKSDSEKKNCREEVIQDEEMMDCEASAELLQAKVVESDSIYFTDELSTSETKCREFLPRIFDDSVENLSESDTWILEKPQDERLKEKQRKIEGRDSAISESPTESTEFTENKMERSENCARRPDSADTVVIKNAQVDSIENEEISRKVNLSNDASGTYMDASSRDFLNSSDISLAFDKSIINPHRKANTGGLSKSARGSSSSPLQQRIPWNAPKRGSSLNNATSTRFKKPEKMKSKQENLQTARTKSLQSKPTLSQSSGENQLNANSNFSLNGTKRLESSILTSGRQAGKSNIDLPERRSRSYATPRKNESSPRNSVTSQLADAQRVSRSRNESEKSNLKKLENSKKYEKHENSKKSDKLDFSENLEKSTIGLSAGISSRSCVTKTSSKSCIPVLKSRIRAKSPMRGPLTMSTSSWREETLGTPNPALENIQAEGSLARNKENSFIIQSPKPYEILEKNDAKSSGKLPESRTVIYVNIVTEQEHSATRVVDPKKFLEYLKDRELKIQSVFDQEIGAESSLASAAAPESCSSPRILTVVSSAVGGEVSSNSLPQCSNNSALTGSWSVRVEQREIEVSAKPSVIDTSTSISDLPEIFTESRGNLGKFEIFEVPKELTKDEYIVLLEALNQDPNLHQLREMHKLCNKLGLGFHE